MSRREWNWLLAALLIGLLLRLINLDQLAVEHWDEAVYASGYTTNSFPQREFHAPWLWPATVEAGQIVGAMGGLEPLGAGAMLSGIMAGVLTILAVWWSARRWWSPSAGVAGAWLVALNEFHIAYSTTCLTDVPVTLLVLLTTGCVVESLVTGQRHWMAGAGIALAVGWWIKYLGWLPLPMVLSGGLVWVLMFPRGQRPWRTWLLTSAGLAIAGLIAWLVIVWDCTELGQKPLLAATDQGFEVAVATMLEQLPRSVWWGLIGLVLILVIGGAWKLQQHLRRQSDGISSQRWLWLGGLLVLAVVLLVSQLSLGALGGYLAVAKNHRGYVQGWSAWPSGWSRQVANFGAYTGGLTVWSFVIAWWAGWSTSAGSRPEFTTARVASAASSRRGTARSVTRADVHKPSVHRWSWGVIGGGGLLALGLWWWTGFWGLLVIVAALSLMATSIEWCRAPRVPLDVASPMHVGMIKQGFGEREQAAGALLAAWFVSLTLVTPLYLPYPRLLTPWWLAAVLLLLWGAHRGPWWRSSDSQDDLDRGWSAWIPTIATVGTLIAIVGSWTTLREDRRAFQQAAAVIAHKIESPDGSPAVVCVAQTPALQLHLQQHGIVTKAVSRPAQAQSTPAGKTYLAIHPLIAREPAWEAAAPLWQSSANLTVTVPSLPSRLFWFDSVSPRDWSQDPEHILEIRVVPVRQTSPR